jgi:hypothetical protein
MDDTYLGDGVYASFDGYQIWLDTRAQHPVNRIALEPSVYAALTNYVALLSRQPGAHEVASEDTSGAES